MTRSAKKTAAFLAAHAAPLPAHVTRESIGRTLDLLPKDSGKAPAIATNATYATLTLDGPEGLALCTVSRPRPYDRDGLFEVALCDGRTVAAFASCPTVKRAYEACYSYLAAAMPHGADPAAEVESYRASFRENWEGDLAASAYPAFKASSLTRAARWAFRIGAAEAALAAPEAPAQLAAEPTPAETEAEALLSRMERDAAECTPRQWVHVLGLNCRRGKAPGALSYDVGPASQAVDLGMTRAEAVAFLARELAALKAEGFHPYPEAPAQLAAEPAPAPLR